MGRINTTTEQDLQHLGHEYRQLLPDGTTPGLFPWFITPNPTGGKKPYANTTEAQHFTQFAQETLRPHKNHPQAHLLWDILAVLYYITPIPDRNTTVFLSDTALAHDLKPFHQKLTQKIYTKNNPHNFQKTFTHPQILLDIYHATTPHTPAVSLFDVWLYYQHTIPTWRHGLHPIEEDTFNLLYEHANTKIPPQDRGSFHQRLRKSAWVELFTTPTPDGSRTIDPIYLMDWENHPNWGTYQHITTQDPAPTITYPTPVANRTGRLLLNSPHTEHLLWYTTTHPGPTPAHQRLETMPHDVFIEWVLTTHQYTNHEFNVTHRLLARWAGITDSSSDKDKAAVTMLALTIHDRITNTTSPDLPGPLLLMLHETPPFLDLPVTVQDTILNQYLTPINGTITLNPTTGHTVS